MSLIGTSLTGRLARSTWCLSRKAARNVREWDVTCRCTPGVVVEIATLSIDAVVAATQSENGEVSLEVAPVTVAIT